ncbi:MAG TPA: hypothetical protein VF074_12050 [Pyrinomonadaceae bacterium]
MSQSLFAEPRLVTSIDDCLFYHTLDVPGYGTINGFWDIRGNESEYLGGVDFTGTRVLEIGPASGQLSFFMERAGAEVVSADVTEDFHWDFFWDLYDQVPADLQPVFELNRDNIERIKNSYWFLHRAFGSNAKVHYGNTYELPRELGEFDISVLACILLHSKYPHRILENCARLTREKVVVVEPFRQRQLTQSSVEFLPVGKRWWDTWWGFSPKFFMDVLSSMGFVYSKVSYHTQKQFDIPEHMFTVVASRNPLTETAPGEEAMRLNLGTSVERLRMQVNAVANLPINLVNLSEVPLSPYASLPLFLGYHWRKQSGELVVWDGIRTPLPLVMHKGDEVEVLVMVQAPPEPGAYLLEISMVREGVTWYDDQVRGLPLRIEAVITSAHV